MNSCTIVKDGGSQDRSEEMGSKAINYSSRTHSEEQEHLALVF